MRKRLTWLMLFVLAMLTVTGAYAESRFRVIGYDHEDTGHVWQENLFFERMEALTGVQLDLKQYHTAETWAAEKAALLKPDSDLPDALFKANLTPLETQQLYEAGVLMDLTPYLAEAAPHLWSLLQQHPDWMEAITLPGGAIVALPAIDELQFTNIMWINKTWLNRVGKTVPTTAEELTEVLRAFRDTDLNGNGKRDEIPLTFSSLWDLRFLAHAFGINANDYYLTCKEGVVSSILTTDENRAFLEWLHLLWEEKLLDQNGFSGLRDIALNTGEDADAIYGVMLTSTPVELAPVKYIRDYVAVPPMVYEGKQVYRDLTGDVIRGTFAITTACQDPAALLKWVDYLYTEAGFILSEAGLVGEDFTWNDDGTWLWDAGSESLNSYLADITIRSGSSTPGFASVDFQLAIDDADTRHVVSSLVAHKAFDELPMPLVYLTQEQQERANAIIYDLGMYAEYQMVWFVTGDKELNDETWAEFCQQVEKHHEQELVSIFQTAVDHQQ